MSILNKYFLHYSGDYILSKDNWRIGLTSLLSTSLGLSSFKNVFWSNERNPGNKFYYNCMEVSNNSDSDKPWDLDYRYTGYINITKSGYPCKVSISLNKQQPHNDFIDIFCNIVNPPLILSKNVP